jgi:hypothetical protein
MTNDAKTDLIYAILAMDSYNRGYGFGISSLPSSGNIGSYQITRQSGITVTGALTPLLTRHKC